MAQEQKKSDLQGQTVGDDVLSSIDNVMLKKKLEEAEAKVEEYLNNWKKERADFINYKKDEMKRLEELVKYGNVALIMEILDIVDDLERAVKHSEMPEDGISQILKKVMNWLNKHGVEKIVSPDKFDPNLHEAIETDQFVDGDEDKIDEIRPGYTLHGKVIRPTRVRILK